MLSLEVAHEHPMPIDAARLRRAIETILREGGVAEGEISLAIVDDSTIHGLNRQYLAHDEPTDVLSFVLERDGARLDGQIVASADMAQRTAARFGWQPVDELLLYVIHGALHLIGHDDSTPAERCLMRDA